MGNITLNCFRSIWFAKIKQIEPYNQLRRKTIRLYNYKYLFVICINGRTQMGKQSKLTESPGKLCTFNQVIVFLY